VPALAVIERLLPIVEGVLEESFAQTGLWNDYSHWFWWHRRLWAVDTIERTQSPAALQRLPHMERFQLLMKVVRADEPTSVSERIAYLNRVFYRAVADSVLQVLRVPGAPWLDVAVCLGLRRPQRRFILMGSCLLLQRLRESLAAGEIARQNGGTFFMADLTTPDRKLQAVARLTPVERGDEFGLDATALDQWQQRMAELVGRSNDLTVDVLDIINAAWMAHARSPTDVVCLKVDDFARGRDLLPQKSGTGRRGGRKADWRQAIADQVDFISSIWMMVGEMLVVQVVEGRRGSRRKLVKWRGESRAVEVSSRAGPVGAGNVVTPYMWSFRPGPVFAAFLLGPGRQVALLSAKALQYNPYTQTWEKRLTRYVAYQWRVRQQRGNYLGPFAVTTILKAIRKSVEVKHPGRTEARFEKTLDTMRDDGVIGGWQYTDDRLPFLERTVLIEPPPVILRHYAQMPLRPKQKALPPAARRPAVGADLERVRVSRGLTQLQLAEDLGVPATELSQVERGAKTPSNRLRKRIAAWSARAPRADRPSA
jgi:DNA-binding XRE family transcriptional regulator